MKRKPKRSGAESPEWLNNKKKTGSSRERAPEPGEVKVR